MPDPEKVKHPVLGYPLAFGRWLLAVGRWLSLRSELIDFQKNIWRLTENYLSLQYEKGIW